jgi:hypothetical protein
MFANELGHHPVCLVQSGLGMGLGTRSSNKNIIIIIILDLLNMPLKRLNRVPTNKNRFEPRPRAPVRRTLTQPLDEGVLLHPIGGYANSLRPAWPVSPCGQHGGVIMWFKQCRFYFPFSWEWFIYIYTTYKHGDDWGMVQMALF